MGIEMAIDKCNPKRVFCCPKVVLKISIILLLASNTGKSFADYLPPTTNERTVETITVKADASNVEIDESTILVETLKGVEDSQKDIPYISSLASVEVLEAYTLQADGRKIRVPKDAIRTTVDQSSNGAPMFSDNKHKIIIFPDVKVGSRLYYKTRTVQRIPEFKGQYYQPQFFSPHHRYGHFEINLIVSDKLPVQVDTKGMQGGLIKESNHQKFYRYIFKQNSVLPPEPNEIEIEDFAPYFTASSFKDQVDLGRAYQALSHPKAKVTPTIQKIADELTKGITDKRLQAKALYQWVSVNIRYVAVFIGDGGMEPHEARTILKNRYGDCKDHTVILEALLRAKGIESSPALISSGDAFKLPKLAVVEPQNHVINYIPSFDLYLDSTAQFAPFGILPGDDLDKPVILTALNRRGHTPVMHAKENVHSSKTTIKINEDGTMTGTGQSHMTGSTEINYRSSKYDDIGTEDEAIVKDRLMLSDETGNGKIFATDPSDLNKPFEEKVSFSLDAESNFPGPGAMTIPLGISNPVLALMAKMKPKEFRNFPFVCGSSIIEESYLIEFPAKIKITRVPKGVNFNNAGIKYTAEYHLSGNKLEVLRHYQRQKPSMACLAKDSEPQMEFFKVLQRDIRSQVFYE